MADRRPPLDARSPSLDGRIAATSYSAARPSARSLRNETAPPTGEDVYKRQLHNMVEGFLHRELDAGFLLQLRAHHERAARQRAVGHAHVAALLDDEDVYKRQCAMPP